MGKRDRPNVGRANAICNMILDGTTKDMNIQYV